MSCTPSSSFCEWLQQRYPLLARRSRRIGKRYGHTPQVSDELLHEAILMLQLKWETTVAEVHNKDAFATTVLTRRHIDAARSASRKQEGLRSLCSEPSCAPDAPDSLQRMLRDEAFRTVYQSLSARDRDILLSLENGMSDHTLADQLGVQPASVRRLRHRVRDRIRDRFNHREVLAIFGPLIAILGWGSTARAATPRRRALWRSGRAALATGLVASVFLASSIRSHPLPSEATKAQQRQAPMYQVTVPSAARQMPRGVSEPPAVGRPLRMPAQAASSAEHSSGPSNRSPVRPHPGPAPQRSTSVKHTTAAPIPIPSRSLASLQQTRSAATLWQSARATTGTTAIGLLRALVANYPHDDLRHDAHARLALLFTQQDDTTAVRTHLAALPADALLSASARNHAHSAAAWALARSGRCAEVRQFIRALPQASVRAARLAARRGRSARRHQETPRCTPQ